MSVIPCKQDAKLNVLVNEFAEVLKTKSHLLGTHGLSEDQFYDAGLFRGAIERIRGQFSAEMRRKREFVTHVLNFMADKGFIKDWHAAGGVNRYDYKVEMPTGKLGAIELKGCLDGNNTNIFERPSYAEEFIIWSLCQNAAADPRVNVWSGLNTRLSAEIISRRQLVDGLVVWDMVCGTIGRPCPKLAAEPDRITTVSQYKVPPPCVYLFPGTLPTPRSNPNPAAQPLSRVQLLDAFHRCFGGRDTELNFVDFDVENQGADIVRRTRVRRDGVIVKESKLVAIKRA